MSENISFQEWQKLDLRAGKILKAEDIANADKLYKLEVDVGESKNRTLVAGLKKHYTKEELIGKGCIVFCNLQSRVMKGIKSEGMILASVNNDESRVILIRSKDEVKAGEKVVFENGNKVKDICLSLSSQGQNMERVISLTTIKFDEWSKIEFKIGEVKNISKNSAKIIVNEKVFDVKSGLNIKKGDKLAVIVNNNNLIIPLITNSVIVPEADIEIGSRVR